MGIQTKFVLLLQLLLNMVCLIRSLEEHVFNYQIEESNKDHLNRINYTMEKSNGSASVELHLYIHLQHNDAELVPTYSTNSLLLAVQKGNNASRSNSTFEQDIEHIFRQMLKDDAETDTQITLLKEFATNTQNCTIKYVVLNLLWEQLTASKQIYNPFKIIWFYKNFTQILQNINYEYKVSFCDNSSIANMQVEICQAISKRSAQILESIFLKGNNCSNNNNRTLQQQLLNEIANLEDGIFEQMIESMYEALEDLISPTDFINTINSDFTHVDKQVLMANLKIFTLTNINPTTELLKHLLRQAERIDHISKSLQDQLYSIMPESLYNLEKASKICIRNITLSNIYLRECPETYLMCRVEESNLQKAAFVVERIVNATHEPREQYALRSTFWHNRYISFELTSNTNNSAIPTATKNVYSKLLAYYWHINFSADGYAVLTDDTQNFYLCAGNEAYWNDTEQHVYTRRIDDFVKHRSECLWFIEDCSIV